MRRLETIVVVTSSWPRTGDPIAGTFVRADALALARSGARVVVLAPAGPGIAERGEGIEVIDVPHGGMFGSPGALLRVRARPWCIAGMWPFAHAVTGHVERIAPDRVVAHWLLPCGLVVARAPAALELVAHGGDVRLLEAMPRFVAAALLARLVGDRVAIRAVSEGIRSRLTALGGDALPRCFVAPMVLDEEQIARARVGGRRLRARYGDHLHLVVARLVEEKRIERAIDRIAGRGVPMVLIGAGPARQRLVEHAAHRGVELRALGALPHDRALEWIAAADRLLAPLAAGEGAPTVVREAEALGVPVDVLLS